MAAAASSAVLLSSCATVFNRSTQPVKVTSQPSGLAFTVTDNSGAKLVSGVTPGEVSLKTSNGYFRAASYTFTFQKGKKVVGMQTLNANVSGWYAGNILIGGLLGMLVIDPLTGAMYTLPDDVTFNGPALASIDHPAAGHLAIASIDQLSSAQRARLVRI